MVIYQYKKKKKIQLSLQLFNIKMKKIKIKSGRCVKDRRDCLCTHSSNPKNGIEYEDGQLI